MKLCVLGDSHVASVKKAWDKISSVSPFDEIDITFFASTRTTMKRLEATSDKLVPAYERLKETIRYTSNGLSEVRLHDYDAFLIYGGGFRIKVIDHNNYSKAVVESWLMDSYSETTSYDLCSKIRSMSDKPILVGANPLLADENVSNVKLPPGQYRKIIKLYQNQIFKPLNCKLLKQPEETISDEQFTISTYSSSSTRLETRENISNIPHPLRDKSHMNAKFGTAFWKSNVGDLESVMRSA